jgi:hypothetical protein
LIFGGELSSTERNCFLAPGEGETFLKGGTDGSWGWHTEVQRSNKILVMVELIESSKMEKAKENQNIV